MIRLLRAQWPFIAMWLLASALLLWLSWNTVLTRAGWDPDDQLRLVQLRDFLGGQSWFDTTQYRMNAPEGAPMHWSRLIELPLGLVVVLTTPLLGVERAEMAAGIIVPMLCLGGIAFLLSQVAGKIAGRPAAIVACMLALIAPAMLLQLRPMRIDHHGWQIFCAVLGFATLYWTDVRKAGLVLGAALAVWVHISLEGAPMTVAFFFYLGWRWIKNREESWRLFWTLGSFALGSLILFFGTQSSGLSAPEFCDTVSPAHIWAILTATAILLPALWLNPQNRLVRVCLTMFAGVAALAILLWLIPRCSAGAFSDLDPIVRSYWYANIREGLPVWHQDLPTAVTFVTPLFVAWAALCASSRLVSADKRGALATAGFFLIYASLLSLLVFRTVSVATAFTIIPLAICLSALVQGYRTEPRLLVRLSFVPLAIGFLASGMIAGSVVASVQNRAKGETTDKDDVNLQACESVISVASLLQLKSANIAAPLNIGPAILMTTPHNVLASNYHRNQKALRDQIDLFRLSPDKAKAIIDRRAITHLVSCSGDAEMDQYVRRAPNGLWAQINSGRLPDWLEYQGTIGKGLKVWRVR
jgi:hypothetical protein